MSCSVFKESVNVMMTGKSVINTIRTRYAISRACAQTLFMPLPLLRLLKIMRFDCMWPPYFASSFCLRKLRIVAISKNANRNILIALESP